MQTIGRPCSYEPSWRPRYRGTTDRTIASPSYSAAQVDAGAPLPVHEGDELAAIPERGLTGVGSFGLFPCTGPVYTPATYPDDTHPRNPRA